MYIDGFMMARALHILGVVLWIGGVAMVTLVLLPAIKNFPTNENRVAFFEKIESRFAWQARITTLLTGLSGFYMLEVMGAWIRFSDVNYWWMYTMIIVWSIFTIMLFILEPLILHDWFIKQAEKNPEATFKRIQFMHWILLTISLLTVFGAVIGSHGGQFSGY